VPSKLWAQLRLNPGDNVLVAQGQTAVVLPAREDTTLADDALRVSAGHVSTIALGPMFGPIALERA
jgi:NADH-quinone oxidoreductase subunit G